MDATPTEDQLHAFRQDGIGHAMIQVEKLLCELLGREWSADGMSVDSLARELAASHTGVDQLAALLPGTYYTDPPDGGNVSVMEQLRRMAEDAAMWRNHKGAIESLSRAPIDMVLHCPACGAQHIDGPESLPFGNVPRIGDWHNPPHRSHLCDGCGHIWRPADVPTNGVAAVKTTGKHDSPVASRAPAEPMVSYTHVTGGARFRQLARDPLPPWAYDVQPCAAHPTESAGPAPAYLRAKDALHEAGWSFEDDWFTFEQSQIHQDDVRRIVAAALGESHEG